MDIMELSSKMEADLLESHTSHSILQKPLPKHIFSPRVTRSQTHFFKNSNNESIMEEELTLVPNKRNHHKVDDVEKIYLNKKAKVVHKNLETIYEYPLWKRGSTVLLGSGKVKRSLYLDREFRIISKQKSKLRKMKIKRLGKKFKLFKLTDDEFKRKMLCIESYLNGNDTEMSLNEKDCHDVNLKIDENEDFSIISSKPEFCNGNGNVNTETAETVMDDSLMLD